MNEQAYTEQERVRAGAVPQVFCVNDRVYLKHHDRQGAGTVTKVDGPYMNVDLDSGDYVDGIYHWRAVPLKVWDFPVTDDTVSQKPNVVSIALEAEELVNGARQSAYGHPVDNFSRIAGIWSSVLDYPVTPKQVALCMAGVKLAREAFCPKRDNRVDAIGYLLTADMVED